jgi:predicted acetylornithine/succinylornithine family transaminase
MTALSLPVPASASTGAPTDALLPVYRRLPIDLVRGRGCELIDSEGRTYLDFTSGIAVNALGYDDPGIRAAMMAALDSGLIHVSNLYHTAPGRLLADALVARSFASSVFFCNSGAEANEGAFKFARRWARGLGGPAKHEIIALRGGFHGRLFASLAATDRPNYRAPFRPLAGGIGIAERSIDELDALLNAETVAALIVEPVQGEGGVRVLDSQFMRDLRELTAARRIALIFDEIQCGLGRTGHLFAYERSGVHPDLLTLAKPLAGGLPMGAVLLNPEIASAVKPGDHATTFGGGPFVASVALHVLERIADQTFLKRVRDEGAWLGVELGRVARQTARIRAVRGAGYIWGLDVVDPAAEIVTRALDEGLLVCTAGEHTIRLLPPLVARRDELERGLAILRKILA